MNLYLWLILYWTLFGVVHSVLAMRRWKSWMQQVLGKYYRYYRFVYSLIALILLLWVLYFQFSLPARVAWPMPLAIQIIAGILAASGIIIMVVSMRKYFFTHSGIDVFFQQKPAVISLQTNGLHRFVRHPLYTGTLLMVWALWFLFPTWANLIGCIMITLYTVIGTVFEERKLLQEFGDAYAQYQRRVPMLFPFYFTKR